MGRKRIAPPNQLAFDFYLNNQTQLPPKKHRIMVGQLLFYFTKGLSFTAIESIAPSRQKHVERLPMNDTGKIEPIRLVIPTIEPFDKLKKAVRKAILKKLNDE